MPKVMDAQTSQFGLGSHFVPEPTNVGVGQRGVAKGGEDERTCAGKLIENALRRCADPD